jgi:O-antigen ligase
MLNRLLIFGTFGSALLLALVRLGRVVELAVAGMVGGLIVAWSLASHLWATFPDLSFRRGVAFLIVYVTLLCLVAVSRSTASVFRALTGVFVLITLLNILVMVAMPAVSWTPIGESGIFDAKNSAGTMAMLTAVLLGGSLFIARHRWTRLPLILVYVLAWCFLIATRSKTSIGVAAVMMVAGPLLYLVLGRSRGVRLLLLLTVIAAALGAIVIGAASGITERDVTLALFGDLTFSLRTPIWAAAVRTIAERPWLGHGFGSFWDVGLRLNPLRAPWNEFFMNAQVINTAHDGYLDQLLQTGILGFSLGLVAIARCLHVLQSAAAATQDRVERVALTGLLCVAICIVLNNLLESYLFRPGDGIGFLFFLIMLQAEKARLDLRRQRWLEEKGAGAGNAISRDGTATVL